MASLWEELEIDPNIFVNEERKDRRDLEEVRRTTQEGAGVKPDGLKLYNRYLKQFDKEPITARKYLSDPFVIDEIKSIEFLVFCTQDFFMNVFGVSLDDMEAVKIASEEFRDYYIHGTDPIKPKIDRYYIILHAIVSAPDITDAKLKATLETLTKLELDIPHELTFVKYYHDNYKNNQQYIALKDAIRVNFPQINNENILNKIASKALR